MSKESEIKQIIRNIAAYNSGLTLFEAVVTESKDTECSIKYQGLEHKNVRLVCGFSQSLTTMIIKPAVGSTVLAADLSGGKMRDLVVLMVEKAETVIFNGGKLGGLIKIEDLTKKLNDLTDKVNALVDAFNSHTHVVNTTGTAAAQSGSAAAPTSQTQKAAKFDKTDYEDQTIKH